MPTFAYSARSKGGERIDGSLEAPDRRSVINRLHQQGCVPIAVQEKGGTAPPPAKKNEVKKTPPKPTPSPAPKASTPRSQTTKPSAAPENGAKKSWKEKLRVERRAGHIPKMRMRTTLLFTRELADLVSSGMPLGHALKTLARRDTRDDQGMIIKALHDDIVQGQSLSEALRRHPDTFSELYVSMVRAGEASGQLETAMSNVVNHYERTLEAREKVVMAMVYPLIIMAIGVLTVVFCMLVVVPRFAEIFQDLDTPLPGTTRLLINMSTFLGGPGGLILLGVGGLSWVAFSCWKKTDAGELVWHGLMLRMPIVRGIVRSNAFVQFARTLGGLMQNGVPVLKALDIVRETMGNRVVAAEIAAARDRVEDGATISGPLAKGKVFPAVLTDMLAVGEHSGNITASLGHIARRYDDDLNRNLKLLTTILEPMLMLLMAVVVGFIALSMMMAVFSMSQGLDM